MAWTAPRTWIVGEIVTATMLNTHLRDNLLQLRSDLNRESSFVVAASDAPQVMKDYADYLCDGNQDQTEISAAIAACGVIGGKVVLSSGTFLVDNPITFANSYVTLQGQGESTIIKVKNAANTVFKILDISSKTGLNLCDFKIDGNRANNTNGGSGIYFNGTTKCRLSNLTIINTYASSVYIDTGSNENEDRKSVV